MDFLPIFCCTNMKQEARNGAIKGQGRGAVAGGMKALKAEFNK